MEHSDWQVLAIALGLGLLVGLQRERSASRVGGIRTFALLSLLGGSCAMLGRELGGWIVVAGFLGVAALLVLANVMKLHVPQHQPDPGQTTEVAALLMYVIGAYLVLGDLATGVALGTTLAVLLYLKQPLHSFVQGLNERDLRAIMQFAVISLVILPVLPDRTYGPYDVLNPADVWRMVVLIVAISLCGYVAYKLVGQRAGAVLGGFLGGLISSTATTVSFAQRTVRSAGSVPIATLVISIASTVAVLRVLFEVGVVAGGHFAALAPPLAAFLLVMVGVAAAAYLLTRGQGADVMDQENPAELKGALLFGALYALILLGVAAAKANLGDRGLYLIALISGLTDVDAITLSTARFVDTHRLDPQTGWRTILIAVLANMLFKAGTVAFLGDRRLGRRILALFGVALVGGILILSFWSPDLRLPF
jgi:uncharacterized membrane protein (DUF4010 family)